MSWTLKPSQKPGTAQEWFFVNVTPGGAESELVSLPMLSDYSTAFDRSQVTRVTVKCAWGQDDQTVSGAGRTAAVSYGCSGDCGPSSVLSSTRGMRQLKEPSPLRITN